MISTTNRNTVSRRRGASRWVPATLGILALGGGCGWIGAYVLAPMLGRGAPPASPPPPALSTVSVPVRAYPSGQHQVSIVEKTIPPPPEPAVKREPENAITTTIEPSKEEPRETRSQREDRSEASDGAGTEVEATAKARDGKGAEAAPAAAPAAPVAADLGEPAGALDPEPVEARRNEAEAPRPGSEGGPLYRVQVGRFAAEGDARALAEELKRDGLSPSVVRNGPEGKGLYRVQVGTFRQRENADKALEALRKKQLEPYLAEDGGVPERSEGQTP
jgi:cell division protein FtsN